MPSKYFVCSLHNKSLKRRNHTINSSQCGKNPSDTDTTH